MSLCIFEGFNFDLFGMQGLIRLLSTCASGSPLGSKTLLLLGISGILKDILAGSGISTNASVSPALSRPAEQVLLLFSGFYYSWKGLFSLLYWYIKRIAILSPFFMLCRNST